MLWSEGCFCVLDTMGFGWLGFWRLVVVVVGLVGWVCWLDSWVRDFGCVVMVGFGVGLG